jgi:hypothetical protein
MALALSVPAVDASSSQLVQTAPVSKAARSVSTLLYPTAGQAVDVTLPFEWRSVAGAEGYSIDVGTTLGGNDVWSTGKTVQTSASVPASLPVGRILYARVWTYVSGVRYASPDVAFEVPPCAAMVYPLSGDPDVDFATPFSWTAVGVSQGYRLTVGTTPGGSDTFDSGTIAQTSALVPALPVGGYFGRLATLSRTTTAQWQWRDFTLQSTGSQVATLTYPTSGASNVDIGRPFTWTAIPGAEYRLMVGLTPGASDLADSGNVAETSFVMPKAAAPGWARLWTFKFGRWGYSDAPFTTGDPIPNRPIYPLNGAVGVDTGRPFEWSGSPLASAYRLEIGTGSGRNELLDTREIGVLQRFTGNLPVGGLLYGRVSARFGEVWKSVDFTFTVSVNGLTMPWIVPAALKATDFVRAMADAYNNPVKGTLLDEELIQRGTVNALCTDYAAVLLKALNQMRSPAPARILNVALNPNSYDGHTLVEMREPGGESWMILDPTFDLTVKRASDGAWAMQEDVSRATQAKRWNDVSYVFLGPFGDSVAQSYYIDYPLLYLNTYPVGSTVYSTGVSVLPFMDLQTLPTKSVDVYLIRGTKQGTYVVLVDGEERSVACTGTDNTSYLFYATVVDKVPGDPTPLQVYSPHRFVF